MIICPVHCLAASLPICPSVCLPTCLSAWPPPCLPGRPQDKEESIAAEFIREGLTAIVSVKVENPEFEGQTKVGGNGAPDRETTLVE